MNEILNLLEEHDGNSVDKLVDKFIKTANEFQSEFHEWFKTNTFEDGSPKSVHDHYILAWNDLGVQYGVKNESEMPEKMKEELFARFEAITPIDDDDDTSHGNAQFA